MLFEKEPAPYITDRIMTLAVLKSASELRIEAGEYKFVIQLEIGSILLELATLKWEIGLKLISRFKILAGIAAADKNKVDDGLYTHSVAGKTCYVRLILSSGAYGDSLTLRLIDVA